MPDKMALHHRIACLVCLLASGVVVQGFYHRNSAAKIQALLEKLEDVRSIPGPYDSKTVTQPPAADPRYPHYASVAGPDGQIDAKDLQLDLAASGISMSGSYTSFSLETCRVLIAAFDRENDGKMGFYEYKEMWTFLTARKATFEQYNRNRSGKMEPDELQVAIRGLGYRLSPQALNIMVKRYSINDRITFDDFVACEVRLRVLTEQFRRRDTDQTGVATFRYDDFIQVAMFT